MNLNENLDPGSIKLKVLSTNDISITLLTEEKFKGKVIQPEAAANRLVGEHGFSMSIEINDGQEDHLFLLDTGGLTQSIIENGKQLGMQFDKVEKLILSHGHFDHFGGFGSVLPLLKEGTELLINENCYKQYYAALLRNGDEISPEAMGSALRDLQKEGKLKINKKLPALSKNLVQNLAEQHNLKINDALGPIRLCKGAYTSGEIEIFDKADVTKGMYIQHGKNVYEKDYFRHERSIYINVRDKGLVVITGCGHCGLVNTIKHGQKMMNIDKIYAVIGGFHEEWNAENVIEKKVKLLEDLNPDIVCGMHCTGFNFNKLAAHLPSHTLGVVGTEFNL
jgi:7,8-dihydropterin-6-yl-methyl-4-(beta-D-ribofuranosyl)aminobenzene 5'-phosphate synthase